jgi:dihydrofolate reductase
MRLTVNTFVSLDGVMQGPAAVDEDASNGFDRGGWMVPHFDGDMGQEWNEHATAFLLGRVTYQIMQPFWTQVTDPADEMARQLNTFPKYVVSTTLSDEDARWTNTTVIRDNILERIQELKAQSGDELQVHGSWQLARTLHDAGLVDRYRLLIFPVVVGRGKRLFADGAAPSSFATVSERFTSSGAISLILEPREFTTGAYVVDEGKDTVAK